jgi:hypothetical protein
LPCAICALAVATLSEFCRTSLTTSASSYFARAASIFRRSAVFCASSSSRITVRMTRETMWTDSDIVWVSCSLTLLSLTTSSRFALSCESLTKPMALPTSPISTTRPNAQASRAASFMLPKFIQGALV